MIETSLGRIAEPDGDRVEFIVRTDVPAYQARLPKMGWQPGGGPGSFTRRLDDAPGSEAIFARFTRHVETMIRQSARLERADWETGLAELAGRAEGSGLRWWLYGSGALAVRGLSIEPGDLDVHVSDAALAGRLMADLLVEPVTRMRGWVADAGGRAWAGILVRPGHTGAARAERRCYSPEGLTEPVPGGLPHVGHGFGTLTTSMMASRMSCLKRAGVAHRATGPRLLA